MPLDDLKEKLYNPNEKLEGRAHEASPYDVKISLKSENTEFGKEKEWEAPQKGFTPKQKEIIKKTAWILGGIILVAALVVAVVKIRQSAFSESRVSVSVIGPESVSSNDLVEYRIVYKNENRATLSNAQLLLNYSNNFTPEGRGELKLDNDSNSRIVIGEIDGHSQGEKIIRGKFFAPANAVVYLNADLEFVPDNFNSPFTANGKIGVNVKTSPLEIDIEAPLEIMSGNKIDYVINYRNLSPKKYSNAKIEVQYPKDFNFTNGNPPVSTGKNIWILGELNPGQNGKIIISGNISGMRNDFKIISATVSADNDRGESAVFGFEEKSTKIVASPLFIQQSAKGGENANIEAGENIYYTINYGNVGEVGLRNVVISINFNSKIVDYATLRTTGGYYDEASKMVTWRASEIPDLANLAPGAKKSFRFQFKILNNLPVQKASDKNFVLETVAKIDSPDIAVSIAENKIISSDRLEMKLISPVALDVKGYYKDANIENFGPLPPVLDQETSYVLHWRVTNVSNDLENTKVSSFLPSGVKWTGKVYPESEKANISYNDRTNEVVWNIGQLANAVGVLSAPREVSFQISITPAINQVGSKALLLKDSVLSARDSFANTEVKAQAKSKSTDLYEDPFVENNFAVRKP